MRLALCEARKAVGQTSPNPAVGAVLMIDGAVAAKGHHIRAGAEHAEVACLRTFKGKVPRNAVLYVTLEPCSTAGRTGACTDAILKAGVRQVVIGALDPNPKHAGRGLEILRRAGLKVRSGILEEACSRLNEAYNKWIVTRRPFVVAKCGMSLDGRLSLLPGDGRWITSAASRRHAQQSRAEVDAILVGAETVRTDNPRLTVRGVQGAKQPWRIVLSKSGSLPQRAHLFTDRFAARTVIHQGGTLASVLGELGEQEITSVLIEGGGEILGRALDEGVVDKVQIYLGPVFTGGPVVAFGGLGAGATTEALRLTRVRYESIGPDICVVAYPTAGRAATE